MGLSRFGEGCPASHESVDVEVEIRTKNHKGDIISQRVFDFDWCHLSVHRPVTRSPTTGELLPSMEQILILHGNGRFTKGENDGPIPTN